CGKGCGHKVMEVSSELDIKLNTVYLGKEYLTMLKNPKHGYGSGMNPCIDCRKMMYEEAKKHMEKIGADFLITGEVLHQRPMSQNSNALSIIENETNMEGKVLRPLSAQLLPKTDAEKEGLVDRSLLGSIHGRSRKEQLILANKFGIADPPNSAGGCLLTDPQFSKRIRDLFKYSSEPSINDVDLLKVGRHFRLDSYSKLVVGRNRDENENLKSLALVSDYVIEPVVIPGPVAILRNNDSNPDLVKYEESLMISIGILLRYSDLLPEQTCGVKVVNKLFETSKIISSLPSSILEVDKYRI
ncbi:MAG TPA: tRNA (5-methylaminomethyl-2-thiouridylate)-methyltransferase, partial [Verrucomicrobiae bacterium]|nr:tRNA (5-methylaminomethyl-2-thiouridylate)-methyltransferase [Verrucomicrobiae bacterium]